MLYKHTANLCEKSKNSESFCQKWRFAKEAILFFFSDTKTEKLERKLFFNNMNQESVCIYIVIAKMNRGKREHVLALRAEIII